MTIFTTSPQDRPCASEVRRSLHLAPAHHAFAFLEGAQVIWEREGVGLLANPLPEGKSALAICVTSPSAFREGASPYRTVLAVSACASGESERFIQALLPLTRRLAELRASGWRIQFPPGQPVLLPRHLRKGFHGKMEYQAHLINPLTDQSALTLPVMQFHTHRSKRQLQQISRLGEQLHALDSQPLQDGPEGVALRQARLEAVAQRGRELTERALLLRLAEERQEWPVERCMRVAALTAKLLEERPYMSESEAIRLTVHDLELGLLSLGDQPV